MYKKKNKSIVTKRYLVRQTLIHGHYAVISLNVSDFYKIKNCST